MTFLQLRAISDLQDVLACGVFAASPNVPAAPAREEAKPSLCPQSSAKPSSRFAGRRTEPRDEPQASLRHRWSHGTAGSAAGKFC